MVYENKGGEIQNPLVPIKVSLNWICNIYSEYDRVDICYIFFKNNKLHQTATLNCNDIDIFKR